MFIIEKQEIKDYKWDSKQNAIVKCEPYYNNPCGSDYTILCNDLKTVKGVLNRYNEWINRKNLSHDIARIAIYKCNSWTDDTTKLEPVYIINKGGTI